VYKREIYIYIYILVIVHENTSIQTCSKMPIQMSVIFYIPHGLIYFILFLNICMFIKLFND